MIPLWSEAKDRRFSTILDKLRPGALTRERVIELLPNLEVLDDLRTKMPGYNLVAETVIGEVRTSGVMLQSGARSVARYS